MSRGSDNSIIIYRKYMLMIALEYLKDSQKDLFPP